MTGLLAAKAVVNLAHTLGRRVQGFKAAAFSVGHIAHLFDPRLRMTMSRTLLGLKPMEWWAQTLI